MDDKNKKGNTVTYWGGLGGRGGEWRETEAERQTRTYRECACLDIDLACSINHNTQILVSFSYYLPTNSNRIWIRRANNNNNNNGHFYGAWSLARSRAQCAVQKAAEKCINTYNGQERKKEKKKEKKRFRPNTYNGQDFFFKERKKKKRKKKGFSLYAHQPRKNLHTGISVNKPKLPVTKHDQTLILAHMYDTSRYTANTKKYSGILHTHTHTHTHTLTHSHTHTHTHTHTQVGRGWVGY